jgi:hypothetical protein
MDGRCYPGKHPAEKPRRISAMASTFQGRILCHFGLIPARQTYRTKQFLSAGLCIAICRTPESETARPLLQYGTESGYFTLRELRFTLLSPVLLTVYGVEIRDGKYRVNVLMVPVDFKCLCCPDQNLSNISGTLTFFF